MVNYDRIVPIQKIDFLSMIGTILNLTHSEVPVLASTDVDGNFVVSGPGGHIANQPVKKLDFDGFDGMVLFVAAPDFDTITYNGEALTLDDGSLELSDIKKDGITLYSVAVETNDSTLGFIKQITPEL